MVARWLLVLISLFTFVLQANSPGSRAKLAADEEPGTRLVVTGQVFDPTGTKPVPGVKLYAYHTDAKGVYHPSGLNLPRLKGTVVTDAAGRFVWDTIRPMPYPGGGNPAHIHIEASGGGYPKQWVDELQFTDDPYITEQRKKESKAKGKFASIVTTTRDAKGGLHATFNIRLKK